MGNFRENQKKPIIIRGNYYEDEHEPIIKVCEEKTTPIDNDDDYQIDLEKFFEYDDEEITEFDEIEQSTKKNDEGNLGVFLYQAILATVIAIGYTLLSMSFAPISQNILDTVKSISSNDFSFSTTLYQSVGTFFTYINEQRPLQLNSTIMDNIIIDEHYTEDTTNVFDEFVLNDSNKIDDYIINDDNIYNDELNKIDEVELEDDLEVNLEVNLELELELGVETELEPEESILTNATIKEVPTNVTLTPVIFAGEITFPITNYYRVTSDFGFRINPVTQEDEFHTAYDLAADKGTNILSILDGTIIESRLGNDLGNYITIDHGQGLTSLYGHCDELLVKVGDKVKQGDIIATVGNTGTSTGNHLHFGMKMDGIYIDPSYIFKTELKLEVD